MEDSPESVVRRFYAAWAAPDAGELGGFFHDDAIWVDGPQGVRRGAQAVTDELVNQLSLLGGVDVEVTTLVTSGQIVMTEHVSHSVVNDTAIASVVMAVFEFDADGRIVQWREAYDLTSVADQVKTAFETESPPSRSERH
jgi:limonene-1,2-epoxide hydrolase